LAEKAIQFGINQVANLIGNVVGPHFNIPCAISCATGSGGGSGNWPSRSTSIYKNKAFYTGGFHDNLNLWEMQDFGSRWGVNAGIPGRHLLGKLDVLSTKPGYAAAVERVGRKFWQEGMSIQNAINTEPKLVEVFKKAAETDADYRILHPDDWPGQAKEIFENYQKRGLKAFDNP